MSPLHRRIHIWKWNQPVRIYTCDSKK